MEADDLQDIWFHRYQDGRDIEGRFDYNSWQESPTGLKLAASLDRDVVLAEGMQMSLILTSISQSDNSRLQGVPHRPRLHGPHGRLARKQRPRDPARRRGRSQHHREGRRPPSRFVHVL